jgi:hypothetical protein
VRVRFATNDPTPWPREMPAGENPLPGGIIDYRLVRDASGPVTLQIRDARGAIVRRYSSTDLELDPHPAIDPVAYNAVCQATPSAPFCNVPLYWPAKPIRVGTRAGMHRFAWDLRMDPLPRETAAEVNDEEATGAVPGRTYPVVEAPWAPPGAYTVELIVDGTTYRQPITVRLDPRVRTPARALTQLATESRALWARAHETHRAHRQARALAALLEREPGDAAAALKAQLDTIAPATPAGVRPRGRRRGVSASTTLAAAATSLMAAANAMQWSDVAPTRVQLDAARFAEAQATAVLARWRTVHTAGLGALNSARRAAGQPVILLPEIAAP